MQKALVVLSGGIDSAVTLWWARSKGWNPATLTFLFPGRRRRELEAVRQLRRLSGARESFDVDLPFVPKPDPKRLHYMPHKNLMYYSIAAAIAEEVGARFILGGHIRHDRRLFRDAGPGFLAALATLVRASSDGGRLSLQFPFLEAGKDDIVSTGMKLGVPFEHTWSCSGDGRRHCWRCDSCKERREGFRRAGLRDPLARD